MNLALNPPPTVALRNHSEVYFYYPPQQYNNKQLYDLLMKFTYKDHMKSEEELFESINELGLLKKAPSS